MENSLKHVAAVIRSYNNPHVAKQVRNMLSIGLGRVIVVVNSPVDKGATRGYLDSLVEDPRLQVIEMREGYSWSNALNRALSAIHFANAERAKTRRASIDYVFNVSVEAQFSHENLVQMLAAFEEASDPVVVGTSFRGIQDGNVISLGRSYRHPRNTGMMLRLNGLTAICSNFDSACDEMGGMEDVEFVLRLMAFASQNAKMLDLQVPLIVGKNYHQPTKEIREEEAIRKIVARMRNFRERIESVIDEMHLED